MPGTVTAVAMAKGGVGRTTVAVNLAQALAARDETVLLVDATRQGGATAYLDSVGRSGGLVAALDGEDPASVARPVGEFDLLPAGGRVERAVGDLRADPSLLDRRVVSPAGRSYDHVVVDTPPTLGPMTRGALCAADRVLLPLSADEAGVSGLERTIEDGVVPERAREPLSVAGIVPTRLRGDDIERTVLESLAGSRLGELLPPFGRPDEIETPGLRDNTAFRHARREGVPLARYDPGCPAVDRFDDLAAFVEGGEADA